MTEQQKQAVEERCTSEYGTDKYLWAQQRDGFRVGVQEVINNPEKYGLQPINGWVSVEDSIPDIGEEFNLVQDIQDGLGGPVVTCGEWNPISKRFEYIGTDVEISNVTHWQPLPQPPINEKEEG